MILGCEKVPECHCVLQSLDVPVYSGRWGLTATHFVSECCTSGGIFSSTVWCQLRPFFSGTTGAVSVDVFANRCGDNADGAKKSRLDTEEIVLHLVLPYSPCKYQAELDLYKTHEKPVSTSRNCTTAVDTSSLSFVSNGSEYKGMVKEEMICRQNLALVDAGVFVELPVAYVNLDDEPSKHGSMMQEVVDAGFGKLKRTEECVVHHRLGMGRTEEGDRASGQKKQMSPIRYRDLDQKDTSTSSDDSDFRMANSLQELQSLSDSETVQKLKRRRLTTSGDFGHSKDYKQDIETKTPTIIIDERSVSGYRGLLEYSDVPIEVNHEATSLGKTDQKIQGDRFVSTNDLQLPAAKVAFGSENSVVDVSHGNEGSRMLEVNHGKVQSKTIVSSPELSASKKREWLVHPHVDKLDGSNTIVASSTNAVGGVYRYVIDHRPAAAHPGTVGDLRCVQSCKVCGEREDANGSLICDECEEVFHMTCVNSRMKTVPRVDDWFCRSCKKMKKYRDDYGELEGGSDGMEWWRECTMSRVEKEVSKMSNGKRTKVRIGPKYQAEVPEWTGVVDDADVTGTSAESSCYFGQETAVSQSEKELDLKVAEFNLLNDIWPKGWLPAQKLPLNTIENWLRCTVVLIDEGEDLADGGKAENEVVCGKWRRAPLNIEQNSAWECSCALVWDPRHADCAVPQELPDEEVQLRVKQTAERQEEESEIA